MGRPPNLASTLAPAHSRAPPLPQRAVGSTQPVYQVLAHAPPPTFPAPSTPGPRSFGRSVPRDRSRSALVFSQHLDGLLQDRGAAAHAAATDRGSPRDHGRDPAGWPARSTPASARRNTRRAVLALRTPRESGAQPDGATCHIRGTRLRVVTPGRRAQPGSAPSPSCVPRPPKGPRRAALAEALPGGGPPSRGRRSHPTSEGLGDRDRRAPMIASAPSLPPGMRPKVRPVAAGSGLGRSWCRLSAIRAPAPTTTWRALPRHQPRRVTPTPRWLGLPLQSSRGRSLRGRPSPPGSRGAAARSSAPEGGSTHSQCAAEL